MDDNEKTLVLDAGGGEWQPAITVHYLSKQGLQQKRFSRPFVIGRDDSCDVCLDSKVVSRYHLRVFLSEGEWQVRDLKSTNGTYIDGQPVNHQNITSRTTVEFGYGGGTQVTLDPSGSEARLNTEYSLVPDSGQSPLPGPDPSLLTGSEPFANHSKQGGFQSGGEENSFEYTDKMHLALKQIKRNYNRIYLSIIGGIGALLIAALLTVYYQQDRLSELKALTVGVFYNMKELEIQLASVEQQLQNTSDEENAKLRTMRTQLAEMETRYDAFLEKLGVFDKQMSEDERLILKMARIFGECEVDMPRDFVTEVRRYIKKWQSTTRFHDAIRRAQENNYSSYVKTTMLSKYLPPQFFYLALQESDYESRTVGPRTRFGIAKGIWQFIPSTARRYGLKTGPLFTVRRFDPRDERFDFERATRAAAEYIHDIYTTEAQASGLLVIASYNLGENRVGKLINRMPQNPRERNFWALLKKHKIPKETYDYVFYIFSAAVIGENPRLFGFEFDNPLKNTGT